MNKTFFLSDTHFFHEKLALIRGFKGAHRMNAAIVDAINSRVDGDDVLWLLGDVTFGKPEPTIEILRSLKCHLALVEGNHDKGWRAPIKSCFREIVKMKSLKVGIENDQGVTESFNFVLCHFPLLVWDKAHYGAIHLHGHSHGFCQYPPSLQNARIMDVGCEPQGYVPISAEEVVAAMKDRAHTSIDLH